MPNAITSLNLEHVAGEADEVGADTEAGTRAGRGADGRRVDVEDGERGGGDEGDHGDLTPLHRLAGDDERGNRDGETLEKILHKAGDKSSNINARGGGRLRLRVHVYSDSERIFHTTLGTCPGTEITDFPG